MCTGTTSMCLPQRLQSHVEQIHTSIVMSVCSSQPRTADLFIRNSAAEGHSEHCQVFSLSESLRNHLFLGSSDVTRGCVKLIGCSCVLTFSGVPDGWSQHSNRRYKKWHQARFKENPSDAAGGADTEGSVLFSSFPLMQENRSRFLHHLHQRKIHVNLIPVGSNKSNLK